MLRLPRRVAPTSQLAPFMRSVEARTTGNFQPSLSKDTITSLRSRKSVFMSLKTRRRSRKKANKTKRKRIRKALSSLMLAETKGKLPQVSGLSQQLFSGLGAIAFTWCATRFAQILGSPSSSSP